MCHKVQSPIEKGWVGGRWRNDRSVLVWRRLEVTSAPKVRDEAAYKRTRRAGKFGKQTCECQKVYFCKPAAVFSFAIFPRGVHASCLSRLALCVSVDLACPGKYASGLLRRITYDLPKQ